MNSIDKPERKLVIASRAVFEQFSGIKISNSCSLKELCAGALCARGHFRKKKKKKGMWIFSLKIINPCISPKESNWNCSGKFNLTFPGYVLPKPCMFNILMLPSLPECQISVSQLQKGQSLVVLCCSRTNYSSSWSSLLLPQLEPAPGRVSY